MKTIPMGETVRKIVHQAETHVFGILSIAILGQNMESSALKILDEHTFEGILFLSTIIVLDTYKLEELENVQSIVTVSIELENLTRSYFVVGTAFILLTEEEPKQGRLLVFEVNKFRKIILSFELEVQGCVYDLGVYEKNMIVASINSGVFFIMSQ